MRKKLLEGANHIDVVFSAAGFASRVHGEQRVANVDAFDVELPGEDVAQGGTACHVGVVYEVLARHTGFVAEALEDGSRAGIGPIFAAGVHLDSRTAAK